MNLSLAFRNPDRPAQRKARRRLAFDYLQEGRLPLACSGHSRPVAAASSKTTPRLEKLEERITPASGADAWTTYVGALYHDLLGRNADASGLAYWVNSIEHGVGVRNASAAIVQSQEYHVDSIDAAYATILARTPDPAGLNFWLGQPGDQLEGDLLASDEFYARVGGNNQAFVQAVYQILLGRPAGAAGQQFWLSDLAAGDSRAEVVSGVSHSQEREDRLISDDYERILRRPGDEAGIAFWSQQLSHGQTNDQVLTVFVSTNEYFNRETGQAFAATPVMRSESWWSELNNQIDARAQKGNVDLMFVGDSITAAWTTAGYGENVWNKYYANGNVMNAGIPGDETQNVLWRLENGNLQNIQPKLAVVMIGTNNISANDSPEDIASGVRAIVDALRSRLPETKILVMGILPRGQTADNPLRQAVDAANALISKFADGRMILYMDIGSSLLGADGQFLPGVVFPDDTHLEESGYKIWASAIEPTIKAIVG